MSFYQVCAGRCVEVLKVWGDWQLPRARRPLSPLVLGGIIMTQSCSIRKATLRMGSATITGADSAIIVSSWYTLF